MATNRNDLKEVRQRKYVARDFDGLRSQLLEYARRYYPSNIADFSESSLGGMLLDFPAYVGDVMSFYLDHQVSELNPATAVETDNIEKHLRQARVKITGAAPAVVYCSNYISVPARVGSTNAVEPDTTALPVIGAGSTYTSDSGVTFNLIEDIDFTITDTEGKLTADVRVDQTTRDGTPVSYILAQQGLCVSGSETSETFSIGSEFIPFRRITLSNPNVTDIISVYDSLGNIYYEVSTLTDDVVYKNVLNTAYDNDIVRDALKVVPAPYRFVAETDLRLRTMTLTFGGGSADTFDDDAIPDPTTFAIALPYSTTFSRVAVNPDQLLQTKTLGVAATNVTLTVVYRHGGGLNHNVPANTIRNVSSLRMTFPNNPTSPVATAVRASTEVNNSAAARDGADAPTIDELRDMIPAANNAQERIVTRPDMLARLYGMPSNFGRVFRASVGSNPYNPLATRLYIVSRDANSRLVLSSDTLKRNIVKYLNPYRMISDAVDILDARIVNLQLTFDAVIDPSLNRTTVMQAAIQKLRTLFNIKNMNIDQPIVLSVVTNTIYTTPGIIGVNGIKFTCVTGTVGDRTYGDETFDVETNTVNGIIVPQQGMIFEIKFPDHDIIGRTST